MSLYQSEAKNVKLLMNKIKINSKIVILTRFNGWKLYLSTPSAQKYDLLTSIFYFEVLENGQIINLKIVMIVSSLSDLYITLTNFKNKCF